MGELREVEAMTDMNQCDGCRVGAPIAGRGNHIMPDVGFMGCTKDRYAASDLPEVKSELRWCIDNGTYGPRTGAALRWALEALEAMEVEATP
jgi:hypothetical protein